MTALCAGATVYAKDLDRVVRFYAEVCGLAEVQREPEFVVLRNGPLQIVVVRIPAHIAQTFEVASPPLRREDAALKLVFVVPRIEPARAAALACGGVIDGPEKEWLFQDARVCDGHDPEGNVIQVRAPQP